MNKLSWMLYLAEVSGSIGFVCAVTVIFSNLLLVVLLLIKHFGDMDDKPTAEQSLRPAIKVLAVAIVIGCLIPGRTTIYAIAASEYGEQALHTETATKAQRALDVWLDKQINEGKK